MANWIEEIDLKEEIESTKDSSFDNEDLPEVRDAIVKKLKASNIYKRSAIFQNLVDVMVDVQTINSFNIYFNIIYDFCDDKKVWLKTF